MKSFPHSGFQSPHFSNCQRTCSKGDPFANYLPSLEVIGTPRTTAVHTWHLVFFLMAMSVLPGYQSLVLLWRLIQFSHYQMVKGRLPSFIQLVPLVVIKIHVALKKGHFRGPGPNHSYLPALPGGLACQDSLLHPLARKLELLLFLTNFGYW